MRTRPVIAALAALALAGISGCSSSPAPEDDNVLRIAVVDNGDLLRMQELSEHFLREHPDVELEWVTLNEGELRQRVTTDIATGAGQFDLVSLGAYETSIWADRGLLSPLDSLPDDYEVDDLIPTVRETLSADGTLYALPFYGESSFTMYRKDLFDAAGIEMPEQPTWDFIVDAADKLSAQDEGSQVCLRGKPGWGENMAVVTSMANSYGGRWFDNDWQPQLDSEAWNKALSTYVALGEFAPSDVTENGFNENIELFQSGACSIWVDSTAAASSLTDPEVSSVADQVGFAQAPDAGLDKGSNWLWTWSLAVPASSEKQDLAQEFATWATSKEYTELVADEYGWVNAPPGTRESLYERAEYLEAAPFASLTLSSMEAADVESPTVDDVPYTGIQYVAIPDFQGFGSAVGNQVADALAGRTSVEEALENSQWVTEKVTERTRLTAE